MTRGLRNNFPIIRGNVAACGDKLFLSYFFGGCCRGVSPQRGKRKNCRILNVWEIPSARKGYTVIHIRQSMTDYVIFFHK
jgi:hypothetical protein